MHDQRRSIGIVIVGDNNGTVARADPEIHGVVTHRRGKHHPRNVVARKAERPLDRPGGRHDVPGPDPPKAMARARLVWCVIRQAFVSQHVAMVIHPCAHGSQTQGHIGHPGQFSDERIQSRTHGLTVNRATVNRRAPAPMCRLFKHNDPCAAPRRSFGRVQARNSTANHKHIAERVEMFVCVRIPRLGSLTQTGGLTDERLIKMFPEGSGMNECLIVKARRHEARQPGVDRSDIKFQAGPMILAGGVQSVEQFGRGGALVGFEFALSPEVHQRIGFFRTAGNDAARSVIFKGAPHKHLVIGEQRGRQGIALEPFELFAVETETDRTIPVQQSALCGKTRAHVIRPSRGADM